MEEPTTEPCGCGSTKCADMCGVLISEFKLLPQITGGGCTQGLDLVRKSPIGAIPECECIAFRAVACPETLLALRNALLVQFPPSVYPVPS